MLIVFFSAKSNTLWYILEEGSLYAYNKHGIYRTITPAIEFQVALTSIFDPWKSFNKNMPL